MTRTTAQPQPPTYWFGMLLDAIRDGDFHSARNAQDRLRSQGIDVSLRRLIPGDEQQQEVSRG